MVNPQVVNDQEDFALSIFNERLKEFDEALVINRAVMKFKPHKTLLAIAKIIVTLVQRAACRMTGVWPAGA